MSTGEFYPLYIDERLYERQWDKHTEQPRESEVDEDERADEADNFDDCDD